MCLGLLALRLAALHDSKRCQDLLRVRHFQMAPFAEVGWAATSSGAGP